MSRPGLVRTGKDTLRASFRGLLEGCFAGAVMGALMGVLLGGLAAVMWVAPPGVSLTSGYGAGTGAAAGVLFGPVYRGIQTASGVEGEC
jgi:hypothetical protein